jgi:predicted metal-dependent peptidase
MRAKQQCSDAFGNKLPTAIHDAYTEALIVMQGRAWAYYSVLLNTTVVWTYQCPTAGTDGAYIYVNPDFFMSLPTVSQRAFLLAHEVGHIVLRHPLRGKYYKDRGFHSIVNNAKLVWDQRQYNKAADYVINADLIAHGFEPIPAGLYDDRFSRDHLVDNVYITIMDERQDGQEPQDEDSGSSDEPEQGDDQQEAEGSEAGESGDDEEDADTTTKPSSDPDDSDENEEASEAGDTDDKSDSGESNDSGDTDDQDGEGSEADDDDDTDGDSEADSAGDMSDEDSEADGSESGDDPSDQSGGDADDESDESSEADGSMQATDHDGHDAHYEPQYDGTPEEQKEAAEEDREEIERQIDDALDSLEDAIERGENHLAASGGMDSAGYRHSGEGEASSVNWQGELVDSVTRIGRGGDVTWSRINRRKFANYGILAPVQIGILNLIGFIIDISGSVCRTALHNAMIEVANVIDLMEPTSGCLVMFTNEEMYQSHEVMTGQELLDLTVPNCGCTNMSSALDWMEANGLQPDVTLCFTDGEMYQDDWNNCASNEVVMVLDRHPNAWVESKINACEPSPKVIVASDVQLAS